MDLDTNIASLRLKNLLAVRELLGTDVLGDVSHREAYSVTFSGDTVIYSSSLPAGCRSTLSFPVFSTAMIASLVLTVGLLSGTQASQPNLHSAPTVLVATNEQMDRILFMRAEEQRRRFESLQKRHGFIGPRLNIPETITPPAVIPPAVVSSSAPSEVLPSMQSSRIQGVFLTASSLARKQFLEETMKNIVDAGGSSIVFDVKGAAVLFESTSPMAHDLGLVRGTYNLKDVIALAKKYKLYTIGRFVAIKDAGLTAKNPSTRVKNPITGAVISKDWIDPADDTAIAYNAEVMCELAGSGIDEVNMDYIRFSTSEFGALRVYSGKQKADHVEKFIRAMREAIDRCGPSTKLGISSYAILGWNYDINVETLGQDVVRFAPLLDVISPMAYPSTFTSDGYYVPGKHPGPRMYYLVYRTLKGYADLLGPEQSKKIRPWIQGYFVDTKDVQDQIRAVYDAGFCGFQSWNSGNNYTPTYKAMKTSVEKPEGCI